MSEKLCRLRVRAPDHDVVGLAGPEDVADLLARHQGRGLPADVARLEAVPLGLGEVDGHFDLRDVDGDVPVRVHHARARTAPGARIWSDFARRVFRSSP